jgi:hypothetical protein
MKTRFTILIAAAMLIAACGSSDSHNSGRTMMDDSKTATQVTSGVETSRGSLLFFMNPHGRPCQMQDQYLNDARDEIETLAEIVYVKTTDDRDRPLFYQYGIRSLPAMIVLNEEQQEIRRFSPGIQRSTTILEVLRSVL